MDIVIPLSCESKYGNDELRIALRSIEKKLKGTSRIWLVTDFAPTWVRGVNIIRCPDKHTSNKDANLFDKILLACRDPRVSNEFLFWSDDQVLMKPKQIDTFQPVVNDKTKASCSGGNKWQKRMYNTFEYLESKGIHLNCNFDSHVPQPWNKVKALEVLEGVDYVAQPGFCINTLYYGLSGCTTGVKQNDVKDTVESSSPIPLTKEYLGYNDEGYASYLRGKLFRLFPEASHYELPDKPNVIITPTGDREEQFNTVITRVLAQTKKPDSWIIVDDGKVPMLKVTLDRIMVPYTYIREQPKEYNSLSVNCGILFGMLESGKAVFFEDDDYYQEGYFEEALNWLDKHPLVGPAARVAYSLRGKCYRQYSDSRFSTLHSTALTADIAKRFMPILRTLKQGNYSVDVKLWESMKGTTVDYINVPVSLKGWASGRGGCTKYHRSDCNGFTPDSDLKWLISHTDASYVRHVIGELSTKGFVPDICAIFHKYPTDKDTKHSYGAFYQELFFDSGIKSDISLCEIGITTGSLRAWREIFPDAKILGIDIKTIVSEEEVLCFDATKKNAALEGRKFDIIIEDANHRLQDQLAHLKLFAPMLNPGGLYIIEDIASHENALVLKTQFPELVLYDRRKVKGRWDDYLAVWRKK